MDADPAAAERAFAAGDWRTTRRLARAVLSDGSADPAAREAARRLLQRTGIDPLVPWLIVACLALFAIVALTLR
jgi:hypothetical protein